MATDRVEFVERLFRRGELRVEFERGFIVLTCMLEVLSAAIDVGAVEECGRECGIKLCRLAEIGECQVEIVLGLVGGATLGIERGRLRINPQGLAEIG